MSTLYANLQDAKSQLTLNFISTAEMT